MNERTLILLRHAKSDWTVNTADIDRPLAKRGRRQAPEAGAWLAANVDSIDLAVVSTATRARTTWELAAAELDAPPRTRIDDRVYAASDEELLAVVRDLPDDVDTAVLVGHNPGLEDLVLLLTGASARMTTSALAVVTISGSWSSAMPHASALRVSGRPPAPLRPACRAVGIRGLRRSRHARRASSRARRGWSRSSRRRPGASRCAARPRPSPAAAGARSSAGARRCGRSRCRRTR
jgi:phosphohistidine phosphatase